MEKIPYLTQTERDNTIADYISNGYVLIKEDNITSGNFLTFVLEDEIPLEKVQAPTEMELLQQKIDEQDMVIEELMFIIIPSLIGGM